MSSRRPPVTGRDVAGAGALMMGANLLCAAAGLGVGEVVGAPIPLAVAGFLIGFFVGIAVVSRRFHDL